MSTSETINSNDAHFNKRLAFIQSVFENELKLHPREVTPIAYEKDFPFPYNNFVYVIDVNRNASSYDPLLHRKQPGTQATPKGITKLVIRLPNPISGYNDKVRVENEVAALSIARSALGQDLQHLVPQVFGWASAKDGQGWILQEYMSGNTLLEDFRSMNDQDRAGILGQMADILACFQRYELPDSVREYGGLSFDSAGQYVSAPLSILEGGPFPTYESLVRKTIESKLSDADKDSQVNGWTENGVRDRLDNFLARGLHQVMVDGLDKLGKVLVHADFSTDNVLYDKDTKRLTAILDFDFAHVATVADEFFRSLGHGIGRFPSARDSDEETRTLHKAMLKGFPEVLPLSIDEVDWVSAKAWDDALSERAVDRPSTISGIVTLADLFWLSSQILPFKLCNPVVVSNSSPEQLSQRKKDGTLQLLGFLEDYGF